MDAFHSAIHKGLLMNSFNYKPDEILPNDFGSALHLINSDAVVNIIQYGTYGEPSLELVCEWDDEIATFPTTDEIKAVVVKENLDLVAAAEAKASAIGKLKALGLTTEEVQEAFGL